MFELRERWIEEMGEHLKKSSRVTCTDGYMDLAAIVSEIEVADADERRQKPIMVPNWKSLRRDLSDTKARLGPELRSLTESDIDAVLRALANLIVKTVMPDGSQKEVVDESRRPQVKQTIKRLALRLFDDDLFVAAWNDLIIACRSEKFRDYPYDRVAFIRDTLHGLQIHRRQNIRYYNPIDTAFRVLSDSPCTVYDAIRAVGDASPKFQPSPSIKKSGLSELERMLLAEKILCQRSERQDFIVWLRVDRAYVSPGSNTQYGQISLYPAQTIAAVIHDSELAREAFDLIPEELLEVEIADQQLDRERDKECCGFEYRGDMVYVRVEVPDIERHLAPIYARKLVTSIIAYLGPEAGSWRVLRGHLIFPIGGNRYHSLDWGPKHPFDEPIYPENDRVDADLKILINDQRVMTIPLAEQISPMLNLLEDLRNAKTSEDVVMTSVRAIEHCNSWTTGGSKEWDRFISAYLIDRVTRLAFLHRANGHTFDAIFVKRPDPSPGAPPQPELDAIRDEAEVDAWKNTYDLKVCLKHIDKLRDIYRQHPLWRPLAGLSSILKPGPPISNAINHEQDRIRVCVDRLTRARNAAIHGGPLSPEACDSIAEFARMLASGVLYQVMDALFAGQDIPGFMSNMRASDEAQLKLLRKTGQRDNLFNMRPTT